MNMVADVFGTLMTDQPDGDLFKARGATPSDVYELLMTDEHHHDQPLVHHQSVRLQKCCMKPVCLSLRSYWSPHNLLLVASLLNQ